MIIDKAAEMRVQIATVKFSNATTTTCIHAAAVERGTARVLLHRKRLGKFLNYKVM